MTKKNFVIFAFFVVKDSVSLSVSIDTESEQHVPGPPDQADVAG